MINKLSKESLHPLLAAASEKSAINFAKVFETLIVDKVSEVVEAHKADLSAKMFNETSSKLKK